MSLHLIESTQQEELAQAWVARIHDAGFAKDALIEDTVIVQNAGLGRWLRLWHARSCGISAAVKMPFAQSFIAKELEAHKLLERWNAIHPLALRWQIFEVLMAQEFIGWPGAQTLVSYLNPDSGYCEARCWSLAGSLAELFDRYSVHRPEWIEAWMAGDKHRDGLPHMAWQGELFRTVMMDHFKLDTESLSRRMVGMALHRYLSEHTPDGNHHEPVHVFGISSFPPAYLEFFQKLAASREVYLYHLISSEAYLGDLPKSYRECLMAEADDPLADARDLFQNPLLVANGQAAARFQSLMLSLDFPVGEIPALPQASGQSDLDALQHSLRLNAPYCDSFSADGSVSFHACHSVTREVQVLQQQLLALFAAQPELKPEDIIVMVPEIADYTDAIKSVFSMGTRIEADAAPRKIPYCIADQRSTGDENCGRFFAALLSVIKGRQLFSEVVALLDFDPICSRLGLERDVMKELSSLLQDVGIRWGIDAGARQRLELPAYAEYSWEHGLSRIYDGLLYGEWAPSDAAPYITSGQMLEAVGNLTHLLSPIFSFAERSQQELSFGDWTDGLLTLLNQVLGDINFQATEWMRQLSTQIGELKAVSTDTPIRFGTFCRMIQDGAPAIQGPSGLLRRGVTFCRLQPARHIPSRVVCVLGLNEGSYPRQARTLEFDLMDLQRRKAAELKGSRLQYREMQYLGDTQIRDADRQLFLDCLLNARERLYISYVGQSDLNNESLPPSILVSELLQYLERTEDTESEARECRKADIEKVILRHPLQEWSPLNYLHKQPAVGEAPVPLHFNAQYRGMDAPAGYRPPFLDNTRKDPEIEPSKSAVSGEQLLRFLKDPAKHFLNHKLQVRLDQLQWIDSYDDCEAFELNALENWVLRSRTIHAWLEEKQSEAPHADFEEALKHRFEKEMILPLGHAGQRVWSEEVAPTLELLSGFLAESQIQKKRYTYDVSEIGFELETWELDSGERLIFLGGDPVKKPKYLLEAFIKHIGAECGSVIIDLKAKKRTLWPPFIEGEADPGMDWLAGMLPIWEIGQGTPIPFSIGIAHHYLSSISKNPEEEELELLTQAYRKQWSQDSTYGGEYSEAQVMVFDGDSPASPDASDEHREAFIAYTEKILQAPLDWAQKMTPKKGRK